MTNAANSIWSSSSFLVVPPYQGEPEQFQTCIKTIPYFFAYKIVFFSFQNSPKNLDPSYKMDLGLWGCLGRVKLVLQQDCIGLIWLFDSF